MIRILLPVGMALVLASAGPASAATITFSDSYTGTTNWADTFSLGRFDPALGTLDSVQFVLDGSITTTFRFENRSRSSTTDVTQSSSVTLDFDDPALELLQLELQHAVSSVPIYDGVLDFGGPSGYTVSKSLSGQETKLLSAPGDDLSFFVGTLPFSMLVSTTGSSQTTSGSNRAASIVTSASGAATITYTYSPQGAPQGVPEPASLALAGIALGVLAIARRRKA